jgi:hypothetical protein
VTSGVNTKVEGIFILFGRFLIEIVALILSHLAVPAIPELPDL